MGLRFSLLFASLVIACSDQVEVTVSVPETYRDDVASLILHVLEAPASEPFGCEQVALDDVPPGVLELSETWVASLDEPGGEYVRLDRRADKRLWVEGVDVTGLPLLEGCAELSYVGDDRVVEIELEPTVVLDLFGEAPRLSAVLRDFRGDPRPEATIAWRRVEPGGLISEGSEVTDELGRARLDVGQPTRSGPSLVEFLVRWSRVGKTVFQGFAIPPVLGPIPFPNVVSSAAGRIGPGGSQAGVGVFEECGGTTGDWGTALVAISPTGSLESEPLHACISGTPPEVAVLPVSADRDRIVTLNNDTWQSIEVSRVGSNLVVEVQTGPVAPVMLLPPRALWPVGPCDGTTDQVLAVNGLGGAQGVYRIPTENGMTAVRLDSGPFSAVPGVVGGAGCVSDGAGGERRVVLHTVRNDDDDPILHMRVADVAGPGSCRYIWDSAVPHQIPTVTASATVERHLVYPVVKAGIGDVEIQAARLDLSGGGCRPLPVLREPISVAPVLVQSGDMDGDGLLDLVAVSGSFGFEEGVGWVFNERVWASLGVEHDGTRLAGLSTVLRNILVTGLRIYDGDGDGLDDLMMIANPSNDPEGDPMALGVLMGMPPAVE